MYIRRLDMIGANIDWHRFGAKENQDLQGLTQSAPCDWSKSDDHVITLAGTRDTWTPVCLARAGLIVWDPKGIPKLTKQKTKWYSPSQV